MSGGASVTIQVACPKCGKHLKAPAAAAGKKARCPSCQSLMMLPAAAAPAPPSAAGAGMASSPQPSSPYPGPQYPQSPFPQSQYPPSPFPQSQYPPPPIPNPGFPSAPLPNLPIPGAVMGATQQPGAGSALSGGLSDLLDEAQPSGWSGGDGYAVAAPEPSPTSSGAVDTRFEAIAPIKPKKKRKSKSFSDNGGALAGLGLMVLAVLWFVGGLFVGYIFFYPPILFLIGLVAFLKGLFSTMTGGD